MRFRKKPIVIDAFQFMGHEAGDEPEWFVAAVNAGTITRHRTGKISNSDWLEIQTLEGRMSADPTAWVICGIKGEVYPCRADIFEATYERVD